MVLTLVAFAGIATYAPLCSASVSNDDSETLSVEPGEKMTETVKEDLRKHHTMDAGALQNLHLVDETNHVQNPVASQMDTAFPPQQGTAYVPLALKSPEELEGLTKVDASAGTPHASDALPAMVSATQRSGGEVLPAVARVDVQTGRVTGLAIFNKDTGFVSDAVKADTAQSSTLGAPMFQAPSTVLPLTPARTIAGARGDLTNAASGKAENVNAAGQVSFWGSDKADTNYVTKIMLASGHDGRPGGLDVEVPGKTSFNLSSEGKNVAIVGPQIDAYEGFVNNLESDKIVYVLVKKGAVTYIGQGDDPKRPTVYSADGANAIGELPGGIRSSAHVDAERNENTREPLTQVIGPVLFTTSPSPDTVSKKLEQPNNDSGGNTTQTI